MVPIERFTLRMGKLNPNGSARKVSTAHDSLLPLACCSARSRSYVSGARFRP
jgi:hypothetical protein